MAQMPMSDVRLTLDVNFDAIALIIAKIIRRDSYLIALHVYHSSFHYQLILTSYTAWYPMLVVPVLSASTRVQK